MNENDLFVGREMEKISGTAMAPEPTKAPEPAMVSEPFASPESNGEPYAADEIELEGQQSQEGIPESPDCSSDTLPLKTEPKSGKKTLQLPDLVSMWKYMLSKNYANRRLLLYSFLNQALRNGHLSDTVGFRVLNRVINREACEFTGVSFWKIDRENFYADVEVKLKLQSPDGQREWKGVLECWCSFEGDFNMSVESLVKTEDREEEGYVRLSPFLVPYMTNQMMDKFTEQVWIDFNMPEAIGDPNLRNATKLAKRMGLTIMYLDVYEHQDMDSIIFFEESDLVVGEDRVVKEPDGTENHIKTGTPTTMRIPANTIVVNTNRIRRDYSAFNIFHECIHYLLHYMFFRLQKMASNDIRLVKTVEVEVEEGKELSDPIFFMENQADRGAYGLMMPASDTRTRIDAELKKASGYKNAGGKFEIVGKELSRQLHLPHFRVKPRMVQLGYIEAKGALNYVDMGRLITPFAFDRDSWKESDVTYVLKQSTARGIERKSKDFEAVMATGRYVYADGHIVRNEPRFVRKDGDKLLLTDEAAQRVDDCCLRFVRRYVQKNVGKYVMGRMFYDAHLVEQNNFYLSDLMNQKQLDDLDAKLEYKDTFPRKFVDAFDLIMEKNDETRESTAYRLHMSVDTLDRWLSEPDKRITADFIIRISLMWQIPDWISKMLLDRASIHLSEYDRRQNALEYIRTVLWDQGIEEANKYLAGKGLELLDTYEIEKIESRKRKRKLK